MVNIVRNLKKNGIELTFDSKPTSDVLQWLKSNKYRWSSFQMVWWKKFDQNSWDQVHAQFNQEPAAQIVKPVSTEPVFHGVTFNEFIMLDITASLKSFARDEHLKRNIVFKEKDSLRQSLTEKGLMKRNGAITDAGRKTRDEVIKDSPYNSGMYYSGYDKIKDKWGLVKPEDIKERPSAWIADNTQFAPIIEKIKQRHPETKADIAQQMDLGRQIEKEHTNDASEAIRIAYDHLWEDPNYYTKAKPANWAEKELEKEGIDNSSDFIKDHIIFGSIPKYDIKREPKFKVDDFVKYEGGDTFKEYWSGIVREVRDLGSEYVYRLDAYAKNEDGQVLFDDAKNNEKYEVQLSKLFLTESNFTKLKDQYEQERQANNTIKQNTPIDEAIAAEEKHDKIHSEFLRFTNDEDPKDRFKIYLVNGNEVRKDHIEFTMGGHGYVYGYVPKDEIWIDENLKDKPDDMEATIKHEVYEVHKMRDEGLDYESAHELANKIESGERNKTEGETFTEKLGFRYLNVSGYYGSQSEEGLIEQGWKYIRDIYPIVTEKDYFLGTDGTFETSSEEEFKSIDAPLFRSESLSKYKIKDGILYRGSDHWGKASSCNWYAPFEIKPWQKGNFYYFKIPLSKLTRNKNIIIEGEIKLTPNTSATKIAFLKQIKFIETGETRIDKDYEPDDVEYNHRKVYIPVYMTLWHYAENTDPDSEKFDNINDAVNDLQKTGRGDPDKGFSPVKELLINLKEAWVDTNNQIIEEGEIISYYDFIESNPDNAFVKQFGTEGTIDSNSFEERESSAKKLLDEVYSNIHKDILKEYEEKGVRLNIITPKDGKYRHVSVEDDQGAEIGSFKLRIADHSYNPSNNDTDAQSGNFISIEIANKNETAGRFHGKYGLQFTGDDSYTDVIDAINERIKEIIYKWDIKTPVMENAVKAQTETKDDISEVRLKKLMLLRKFISVSQHEALSDLMMGEEGQAGWEIVDRLGSIIETMPHTYQTEDINTNDKIVYLHYFNGGSDWYIVEKDKLMPQNQAFGYAILNGDSINAEWGYISILELIQNNVELDFYWTPKKFGEVIKKEEKPKQLEPDVIISSELAEPEIIGNVIPKKWEPIVKEAYQFNAKPGIAAIADDIIDLYLYRQMRTYGMYNDKVLQTIGASIKKQKDNMFYVMDQNGSIFLESGGSGRPSYYDEVKEIWGEKFADLAKKDGGVLMRNKEPEPSDKKQELLDEIESLEKNIRNGEKLMQKASFTGDVTKDIVKDRAKLEKKKQEYVNAYGVIPEKQAELSLNSSDYKNEFELNKAIEKLLDSKWNEKQWSPEELQFLKGYSGYGGLDQFGEITKGSLFEYFTPDQVIEKMWGLAYKYGYTNGPVLEPSCGIGPFFDRRFVSNTIEKHGYEINKYSAKIAKLLYPEAIINDGEEVKYFEQLFIVQNYTVRSKVTPKYRLVIGNPPYGTVGGIYMGMGEKAYTHANNYIDYFILRGLDLLEKGGLLIYIIGAETAGGGVPFLDQGMNKVKEMIMERGKLIDAYRLPSGVFARTEVTSDIVVFRKR